MVARTKRSKKSRREKFKEQQMKLAKGSAKITLNDIYAMLYVLVRQNKNLKKDNVMSFPLEVFQTLPKKPILTFIQENGYLVVDIPDESDDFDPKSEDLYLPHKQTIIRKGH